MLSPTDDVQRRAYARPCAADHEALSHMHTPDDSPHHRPTPPLSSASSASTRSSAYTSIGSALAYADYAAVHVASPDDDPHSHALPIPSDALVHMLASDPAQSSSARGLIPRNPDSSRWSESYSASIRSRSSSLGNGLASTVPPPLPSHDPHISPPLSQKPSYDLTWRSLDEKDEGGLMSEEETDDDPGLDSLEADDDDDDDDDKDDERTSAAVIADEGKGLIVHGDSVPINQLHIQPGTTHLLIGSSSTPNAVPAFLTINIPQIAHSLLALDISTNFLGALPPVLSICENLEELNVASNPLRVLPVFLAELTNLRVLIADSTGISTLPDALVDLDKLHTISIRRNKLHLLPSWLCLLPALQTLCIDNNPFQGPWKALVDPLLAKVPSTPVYPPSTPMLPNSAGLQSNPDTETDGTDTDDLSDHESPHQNHFSNPSPEEEDHTITPERAPFLSRATTSPFPASLPVPQPKPLVRTRTTPNRAYFEGTRAKAPPANANNALDPRTHNQPVGRSQDAPGEHEIRKMKSAGDLRRGKVANAGAPESEMPSRPPMMHYMTSQSSTNLLNVSSGPSSPAGQRMVESYPKRFASLGPNSQFMAPARGQTPNAARPQLSQSMWDSSPALQTSVSMEPDRASSYTGPPPPPLSQKAESYDNGKSGRGQRPTREKSSRWGFLKKMSMGKIKPETPSSPSSSPSGSPNPSRVAPHITRPHTSAGTQNGNGGAVGPPRIGLERVNETPRLDLRLSTTGMLDSMPSLSVQPAPNFATPPRMQLNNESMPPPLPPGGAISPNTLFPPSTSSNGLLSPTMLQPRTTKRRSFLPVEAPGMMAVSIPENSAFIGGVVVARDGEEQYSQDAPPTPVSPHIIDHVQYIRREEDRAREAYMRALRSVMAYLKDMHDLGIVQQAGRTGARILAPTGIVSSQAHAGATPVSVYDSRTEWEEGGASPPDVHGNGAPVARMRRPTVGEAAARELSIMSAGSSTLAMSMSENPAHLRSFDSGTGSRSGASSQTLSVATTDSSGSGEERKFKDDKGKRAMVIREIVITERTYVKGLQELVDIYIKPAATPVNILGGVGSGGKDTVVPASERKVVFGGIDALFSFHNDSFLPALEGAAAPLMKTHAEMQETDHDGQLSLNVAKAVGNIFVTHAAFMKMYSSYINNFDSSVQRVKYWTSDKNAPAPSSPQALMTSPSSSQLVGLGISMAMASSPNVISETSPAATGIPNLTTSQRKRIKAYLKRCRLNPRHTQLNLEGYLLLPVQRVPRYKLLLEELLRSTPPTYEYMDDPLDKALAEIALLANNMNEGKRESESRRKLVQWQTRIRGKFPSPLVQPHRRLIMDGPLLLTRVVRKSSVSFEAINAQGDASIVQIDCLAPELTPRPLVGILCNDLLVLCRDPSEGQDPASPVDLWAVLRMQTLPQPASIVHGNALRLVDNKAILYFDAPTPSAALNWYRAINLHIPASKT